MWRVFGVWMGWGWVGYCQGSEAVKKRLSSGFAGLCMRVQICIQISRKKKKTVFVAAGQKAVVKRKSWRNFFNRHRSHRTMSQAAPLRLQSLMEFSNKSDHEKFSTTFFSPLTVYLLPPCLPSFSLSHWVFHIIDKLRSRVFVIEAECGRDELLESHCVFVSTV